MTVIIIIIRFLIRVCPQLWTGQLYPNTNSIAQGMQVNSNARYRRNGHASKGDGREIFRGANKNRASTNYYEWKNFWNLGGLKKIK